MEKSGRGLGITFEEGLLGFVGGVRRSSSNNMWLGSEPSAVAVQALGSSGLDMNQCLCV